MKKGRPKGYSPYVDISYEELGDWLGRKSLVKVSKAWLETLITQARSSATPVVPASEVEDKEVPKIEYKLTDLNE